MRDEMILRKMRSADPVGLEMLMDRYIPYVSAVCWNILRSCMTKEDAEEVVSDVFLAAWEQAADIRPAKVKAWLGAVARNKAKNALRKAGFDLPLEEDVLEIPDDSPGEKLDRQQEAGAVRQARDSLPEKDRQIFLRHYYYGQTVADISREMKMPQSTVKSRLRRGREKLKEYLIGRDF